MLRYLLYSAVLLTAALPALMTVTFCESQQTQPPDYSSRRHPGRRDMAAIQAAGLAPAAIRPPEKSVIFIFLTGGLSHIDTFDMKPDAPAEIRGEFSSMATRTPGTRICEYLPQLAQLSERWSLVRSMSTASSGHEPACHMMLTGRRDLPPEFNVKDTPSPNEWPSMPAVITHAIQNGSALPPAAVLPQPSVNEIGSVRPGQYAGRLGNRWEAWHIDIAAHCPLGNGACPDCFRFEGTPFEHAATNIFDIPLLTLPDGGQQRLTRRADLLDLIQDQHRQIQGNKVLRDFDRNRRQAMSVLTNPNTSSAFDVENADEKLQQRYGKNKFGLSLLMARRLVQAGVKYVQVNLGKNSSWDTHRRNFVNLKDNLLPPLDKSVSALLNDLVETGMIDNTLVVMTGEFGRTPKINKDAGRDHWGPVNTMLLAGFGVQGGRVIGASDRQGTEPIADQQTPENLSATIYQTLGIPSDATWTDLDGRPHLIYRGQPIPGLT